MVSGTFKHFQTLSGATPIDRSPIVLNLRVECMIAQKLLRKAAFIPLAGSGCVGFWEENLLAKQSPEKVTRDHVYNQNGYDTRSRDRRSTLVDK